jgi:hypothetical protein
VGRRSITVHKAEMDMVVSGLEVWFLLGSDRWFGLAFFLILYGGFFAYVECTIAKESVFLVSDYRPHH